MLLCKIIKCCLSGSLSDPQFAGASIIPSSEKYKEEIYFFFSEFNKTARVDEEPYRARIGRICMVNILLVFGNFLLSYVIPD